MPSAVHELFCPLRPIEPTEEPLEPVTNPACAGAVEDEDDEDEEEEDEDNNGGGSDDEEEDLEDDEQPYSGNVVGV